MNIGQAARACGVSAKMIRYYEQIGLISPAGRTDSNYRDFGAREIGELRLIKCARGSGISVRTIAKLLSLWRDHDLPRAETRTLADTYAAALETKIADMRTLAGALRDLSAQVDSPARPDFPDLADPAHDPPGPAGNIVGER